MTKRMLDRLHWLDYLVKTLSKEVCLFPHFFSNTSYYFPSRHYTLGEWLYVNQVIFQFVLEQNLIKCSSRWRLMTKTSPQSCLGERSITSGCFPNRCLHLTYYATCHENSNETNTIKRNRNILVLLVLTFL